MAYVTVGYENSTPIHIFYEDHGGGTPVVLSHGWPLSSAAWEKQVPALLDAGYRVITYDRRGFGQSSKPTFGYNYDTFARDLHALISTLDLEDVTIVGHSMGSGEVAHYIGMFGTDRVRKAVMVAAITPFLLKTMDNPTGVDGSVFEGIEAAIAKDRHAYTSAFLQNFYNVDVFGGDRISDDAVRSSWNLAEMSSAVGYAECVPAWLTDFRPDLAKIDVPTLIIHGTGDRILPFPATAVPSHERIKGSKLAAVDDAPHGLPWTHAEVVNRELISFLAMARTAARAA